MRRPLMAIAAAAVAAVTASAGLVPRLMHNAPVPVANAQAPGCGPGDLPKGALPPAIPIWCYQPMPGGPGTAVQGANSWLDDFEHGLSFSNMNGTGYRIFENPSLDQSKESAGAKIHPSITFRHQNHWMADVRTATDPQGDRNGYGGTYLRPDRTFRFENGKLVVEFDYAAGVLEYEGNNWAELVITTAPKPDSATLGFTLTDTDGFSNFRGHWTYGMKLNPSRTLQGFTINDDTDPSTLKRPAYARHLHAVMSAFQHAGASEVFGGGPYTGATNQAWRTCQGTDPDLNCRDRFRVELSKDTITWYVNGTRYMEHKGLPAETQLPDEFVNGNLYVYFVSWVYRNSDNRETTRFHWDRVAVNPKNSAGQVLPPSAAPGFGGQVPPAPTPTTAPAVPTATRTPTPAPATATRTPTTVPVPPTATTAPSQPTATTAPNQPTPPSGGGLTTVSFNDLAGEQRVLSGQYPAGVLDWGNGQWWLSKPFGQLGTKNLSHNGQAGVVSGSFSFLQPGRLVSLKAFNGGGAASTVTLSCAGKPTKTASVAPGQLATIETGWTGTCSPVTLASSNGWDTNFDDLVIDLSSSSTVTFDDRPGQNQPLDGQYPAGVINWGSGQWYHAGPWGPLASKSVSFSAEGRTSGTFTFVTPSRLTSLKAYNSAGPTTVTLACAGQTTKSVNLAAGQTATITTGWTGDCGAVTVTSSNGWDTNFDDLTFD